jgi:small subunit ribosomal protein S3
MGQKVHPESLRVGYIHDWKSTWFNERDFSDYLLEDIHIREHIENKLAHAGLSTITIKKNKNEVEVNIHTARPGIVIGKSGSEVDALRKELHKMTGKAVKVNILEIKRPELDSRLVAQSVGEQLQNRVAFRRAMKRALTSAMRSGAKGCKIQVSGRLGGAEMARTEGYSDGRVPLHTLRADIDYGFYEARTTFGRIGVKVWINKGEIMPTGFAQDLTELEAPQTVGPGGGGRGRGPGGPGGGGAGAGRAPVQPVLVLGLQRAVALGHDLALVDPALDADAAGRGAGLDETVIDFGAQGVERHAAVRVTLGAGHLGAPEAP